MADYDFTLYDTWQPSTVANAEQILFQVSQGGDSTHTEQFTNMRGAGSLPSQENFIIRKISIIADQKVAVADLFKWFTGGLLDFQRANLSVLKGPLQQYLDHNSWGGNLVMGTAADNGAIGLESWGFDLDPQYFIHLGGGVPFRVRMIQGSALSATTNIKVTMRGIYSLAGA